MKSLKARHKSKNHSQRDVKEVANDTNTLGDSSRLGAKPSDINIKPSFLKEKLRLEREIKKLEGHGSLSSCPDCIKKVELKAELKGLNNAQKFTEEKLQDIFDEIKLKSKCSDCGCTYTKAGMGVRSGERRVGKECRSRWSP